MGAIEVISRSVAGGGAAAAPGRGWRRVMMHTHTYSGRPDHGGTVRPPENYRRLAEWAAARRIDAVGMGSPYTPKAAATFHRYETEGLAAYYAPGFDRKAVRDLDEIEAMLRDANRAAERLAAEALLARPTLFYLDNETPKGRYGHLWWLGYEPDFPAWHDNDQVFDRWMVHEQRPGDDGDEPMPYERRPLLEIVAAQRAAGALAFWAHPTSWWRGDRGRFITNIAAEMPVHALADGYLDGMVIMGYQPWRPSYLAVWFLMLDAGFRVPGVAEMDVGLSDEALYRREEAWVTAAAVGEGTVSVPRLAEAFRAGRVFATSGPLVDLLVDGRPMGGATPTAPDAVHRVELTAHPDPGREGLGRVELLGRGGEVLWAEDGFPGGRIVLAAAGLAQRGYLVARVFGAGARPDPADFRRVRQIAVSGPVYLHPRGEGFPEPVQTRLRLTIRAGSAWVGGEVRLETAGGERLGHALARTGTVEEILPAGARVTLAAPDGAQRTDYLVNANPRVQALLRYLYRGRFLRDFPKSASGEVPPAAWRLEALAEAMREVELIY